MERPRLALRLLACADAYGVREELIGDLFEEIARGRSRLWVCQQLIGLYGFAFAAGLRNRARVTPQSVACSCGLALWVSSSIASVNDALQAWLLFYLIAGILSLFAHMTSRAVWSRSTALPEAADDPGVD
ncbi:MAG TPA: hypothetical protein VH497_11655 [Vicinamibacterales bacterium]